MGLAPPKAVGSVPDCAHTALANSTAARAASRTCEVFMAMSWQQILVVKYVPKLVRLQIYDERAESVWHAPVAEAS